MKDRVEILAPAGSMECLKAAIAAGADALSLIHICQKRIEDRRCGCKDRGKTLLYDFG